MRRFAPFAVLLLAACGITPRPQPQPAPTAPQPQPVRTGLTGLTQAELAGRFGPPPFQLREGSGLKLQWQNAACVLDAYLYPSPGGGGAAVVTHVDARRPDSGDTLPVETCAANLSLLRP